MEPTLTGKEEFPVLSLRCGFVDRPSFIQIFPYAQKYGPSIDGDSGFKKPLSADKENPLREHRSNEPCFFELRRIHSVLRPSGWSKVVQSVVKGILVPMVNKLRNANAVKLGHDLVRSYSSSLSTYRKAYPAGDYFSSYASVYIPGFFTAFGIGGMERKLGREVFSGPRFPKQLTGFGIVSEALDKIFERYRVNIRHVAGCFSCLFRDAVAVMGGGISLLRLTERSA